VLAIVWAATSWLWGIGEALFRTFRGDPSPRVRASYTYRAEDSAGVDSSGE
jgi:hypothetical protein